MHDQDHKLHVHVCFRVRVQATSALLRVHESDPAELHEPSGQQEVEEKNLELEGSQNTEGGWAVKLNV